MSLLSSIKNSVKSLASPDTWMSLGSKALDYGSGALSFAAPFAGAAADVGLGLWNNHQQYKQAKGLSAQQLRNNIKFNSWLIPYQLGQEFEFASRYATDSPKWNVTGLRKAGLNPILAVNGGFSGGNSPHASGGSVGSGGSTNPNVRMDVLSAINAHKQNQLLDEQIEGQRIKNNNEKKNRGLTGQYGAWSRLISELGFSNDDPVPSHRPKDFSQVLDSIGNFLGLSFGNDIHSAFIQHSPSSSDYDKDSFFGRIQSSIEGNREVARITGKSVYQVSKMSDEEKLKILRNHNKPKHKSKGYHIFTR